MTLNHRGADAAAAHDQPVLLDSTWLERWIARRAIQAICPDSIGDSCKRGSETMVVHHGKPTWVSRDSAVVILAMNREMFAAGFRLTASRLAGTWRVRDTEMIWIT